MEHLGVFAKYWQPGKVKTRLAASIGNEVASRVYFCFLTKLIETLQTTTELRPQRTMLYSPAGAEDEFRNILGDGWRLRQQADGDLGRRMGDFFEASFAAANDESGDARQSADARVVVIGTDTPHLSATRIAEAFERLKSVDVVLGPANDGGYYLLGMKNRIAPVFDDMPWSEEDLLDKTVARINDASLELAMLDPMSDIDELEDLNELIRSIDSGELENASAMLPLVSQLRKIISGKSAARSRADSSEPNSMRKQN